MAGPGTQFTLTSRNFRNFLREGDFGLVDPSQPPSETNPPLAYNLLRLADSGIVLRGSPTWLVIIYAKYNRLIRDRTLYLDGLMTRYIQPAIIEENRQQEIMNRRREGIIRDPLPIDQLPSVLSMAHDILVHLTKPSLATFHQFDLPLSAAPLNDLDTIDRQVRNALRHYQSRLPFYRRKSVV